MEAIQEPQMGLFYAQLINSTRRGDATPPFTAIAASVFYQGNARIEPTPLQLIDDTYTCKYSSTSVTGC